MTLAAAAIIACAYVGGGVGFAVWIATMIHFGHPIRETPMRVVKVRGSFLDTHA